MSSQTGKITSELSKNIDGILAKQLVEEFVSLEESFRLNRWKYTQLDGGRICEVTARIIYSQDSGNVNRNKSVDDCLVYIENEKNAHNFPERRTAIHVTKLVRAAYKLRSQRGGVHVSPDYSADESDSRLIISISRWILSEFIRLFWVSDKAEVARLIKELSRYDIPLVQTYDNKVLLQSTSFNTEEEILALLFFAKDAGMSKGALLTNIPKDSSTIRKAIFSLSSGKKRQIIESNGVLKITDLGIARVEPKICN